MDRVSKASELQKQLYRQTCTWVRQQGGLPTYYRLTRYCVSNSRAMAPSEVDGDTAERIGRRVANYINRNHDSTIANPAPAKPGHVRASERESILLMYRKGVADGEPPSIGQIVSALGVSKGLVQRTLAAANYNPLRARNLMKLSASARVVVQLLDRVFPSDGRRVMVLDELLDACLHSSHEINHDQYRLIASEINEAAIGIQLFSSEMVHPNSHRELLIVERGRRSSRAAIEQWLSKHISRHKDRGRLGLPPRIQVTFPYKVFYNPVARDLASVIC